MLSRHTGRGIMASCNFSQRDVHAMLPQPAVPDDLRVSASGLRLATLMEHLAHPGCPTACREATGKTWHQAFRVPRTCRAVNRGETDLSASLVLACRPAVCQVRAVLVNTTDSEATFQRYPTLPPSVPSQPCDAHHRVTKRVRHGFGHDAEPITGYVTKGGDTRTTRPPMWLCVGSGFSTTDRSTVPRPLPQAHQSRRTWAPEQRPRSTTV
ncbi:hypothetical protein N658DRAFT_271092 [Parathielavia hyrcaniae]|uniref:Uncharacterized protein n=1 Tax=Parathielavia hyrcaniae TaxID=113614 RepID=A0AAN6PTB3_9PEZI|nr:hypothetical protein N658DRAFT_271092 [Parathielavia hyrcaniae]